MKLVDTKMFLRGQPVYFKSTGDRASDCAILYTWQKRVEPLIFSDMARNVPDPAKLSYVESEEETLIERLKAAKAGDWVKIHSPSEILPISAAGLKFIELHQIGPNSPMPLAVNVADISRVERQSRVGGKSSVVVDQGHCYLSVTETVEEVLALIQTKEDSDAS